MYMYSNKSILVHRRDIRHLIDLECTFSTSRAGQIFEDSQGTGVDGWKGRSGRGHLEQRGEGHQMKDIH